jgi:hypothetical protein
MNHSNPNEAVWPDISKAETLKRRVDLWRITCQNNRCRHAWPES